MADPLEKLEAAVRKLAADVGETRRTVGEHSETLAEHTEVLAEHTEILGEIRTSVRDIQKTQVALTNAMTRAIKQLGTDKSLEIRVKRLEEAVFGAKH